MTWNKSLPIGTRDKLFKEAFQIHQLESEVQNHFERRGYQRIETPTLEFDEVFHGLEQDTSHRYRFFDGEGRLVVLRPDMTLPIARVISTTNLLPPLKLSYSGKVFRVHKGLAGEYNEQSQAGMELIGYDSLKAELECLDHAILLSKKMALPNFHIELGHAAIFEEIVKELSLNEKDEKELQGIIKQKKLSELTKFLAGYQDSPSLPLLRKLPRMFGGVSIIQEAERLTTNTQVLEALNLLKKVMAHIKKIYPDQTMTVDIGSVPDFKYYTAITFKGYSDKSSNHYLSGGRYDKIMFEFDSEELPAVGLAFNLDQVLRIKYRSQSVEKPQATQTLIHFDTESHILANRLLKEEPYASLSLFDSLQKTMEQAARWEIPRVLVINNNQVTTLIDGKEQVDETN